VTHGYKILVSGTGTGSCSFRNKCSGRVLESLQAVDIGMFLASLRWFRSRRLRSLCGLAAKEQIWTSSKMPCFTFTRDETCFMCCGRYSLFRGGSVYYSGFKLQRMIKVKMARDMRIESVRFDLLTQFSSFFLEGAQY
jgi:hypothetical protein